MITNSVQSVNPLPGPDDFPLGKKFAPRNAGYDGLTWGERMLKRLARALSGNLFDIIMSSTQMMEYVLAEIAKDEADVVIRPVIQDAAWYEFNEPVKYIQRGVEETEKALPEIKQALASKD